MSSFVKVKTKSNDTISSKNDLRETNLIRQKILSNGLVNRYPNNIFIKDHIDYYQKPNEFKFNIIIESNKYSPMYIIYNNVESNYQS
jgi:hypothetical protein